MYVSCYMESCKVEELVLVVILKGSRIRSNDLNEFCSRKPGVFFSNVNMQLTMHSYYSRCISIELKLFIDFAFYILAV